MKPEGIPRAREQIYRCFSRAPAADRYRATHTPHPIVNAQSQTGLDAFMTFSNEKEKMRARGEEEERRTGGEGEREI